MRDGDLSELVTLKFLFKNTVHLYRVPRVVLYGRDPCFTKKLWEVFFQIVDFKILFSSAYHLDHPETDRKINDHTK